MRNFAYAPWGWMVIISWLARVPLVSITLANPAAFNPGQNIDESIQQFFFWIDYFTVMLGGVELFTFICWIVALVMRQKIRSREAPSVVEECTSPS